MLSTKYQENSAKITTTKKEFELKHYEDFTFYTLDTFYVISYFSTYKPSCRAKTFKTYSAALATWTKIVKEEVTYFNF